MKTAVVWLRRDLRLTDHKALFHACKHHDCVLPIFIFDKNILDELDKDDARVSFIHDQLTNIRKKTNSLKVYFSTPVEAWKSLIDSYDIEAAYCAEDYEPYAIKRDKEIQQLLNINGIQLL